MINNKIGRKSVLCLAILFLLDFSFTMPFPAGATDPLDNWHVRLDASSGYGLGYGNGTFATVGDLGEVMTSVNGIDWITLTTGTSTLLSSVTGGNGILVATGELGAVLVSPDSGVSWTSRATGTQEWLNGISYNSTGTFAAVGMEGTILTSADNGVTWVSRNKATGWYLWGISYGGGCFAAVGYDSPDFRGAILTSADNGATWTSRTSGTGQFLWSVAYGNGIFAAVGDGGTILTSADQGVTWISQNSGVLDHLFGIAYGNGLFVAVGDFGTLLTSTDGVTWTSRNSAALQDQQFLAVTYGAGTFVALSGIGALIQSDPMPLPPAVIKGDINNDRQVDLRDALLYLMVTSGANPAGVRSDYTLSQTDPDGDGKIGIQDMIFVFQKISGLR